MIAATLLPLALLAPRAEAFECLTYCGCDWADGNQLTYHINVNDFVTAGATAIEAGADAWDAGASKLNRGANWDFVRGSDHSSDGTPGNSTNEVYKREDVFFAGLGMSGSTAVTMRSHLLCGRRDADVVFNEFYSWYTPMPSEYTGQNDYHLGIVALHEFGHVLGLDHFDGGSSTNLAFMNDSGTVSDIAAQYRIQEDDYLGLVDGKGDSSTGKNLMLQRYWRQPSGGHLEMWSDLSVVYEGDYEGCRGQTVAAYDDPYELLATIVGTGTATPLVEWRLSADTTCFSGTEYVLGTSSPYIGANEPFPILPNGGYFIPAATPTGSYFVCAKIDANSAITETSESDNVVRSERTFTVSSCP